jgi:hypothetical protein
MYLKNFTLTFGKYKGQKIFDTPVSYYQWLLEQKFTAPKESYLALEVGDNVLVNCRYYVFPSKKAIFFSNEGTLLSIKDKYIMVSIPHSIEKFIELTNKTYIDNTPLKIKILKSKILSIEKKDTSMKYDEGGALLPQQGTYSNK